MNKIICLWSCPRNISTALMYSFAQREDTQVFDEPLYAHYLKVSGENHPAREEVLQSLENDGDKVVQDVILRKSKKIVFHKLMAHFLIDIEMDFLSKVSNIIFIRNPKEIITSYSKVIPSPKLEDVGLKQQYQLYLSLEKKGKTPIILDSKYLLRNPESILNKLCAILEIPFDEKMLRWGKGGIKEDGVWANHWYENVHNSTGFLPYSKQERKLSGSNAILAKKSIPYYEFLISKAI